MVAKTLVPVGALYIVEVNNTVTLVLWPLTVFGEGAIRKQIRRCLSLADWDVFERSKLLLAIFDCAVRR